MAGIMFYVVSLLSFHILAMNILSEKEASKECIEEKTKECKEE